MKKLTDPLPLRTTAEWPGFREAVALPLRFGRTRGVLIQYNQARTQFAWSGHACLRVDTVYAGGLAASGWTFANTIDAAGKPIALVTFASPQAEGTDLSAEGRGMMDAATGALIENPADALAAILIDLAGLPIPRQRLDAFRAECAAANITLGGSIEQPDSAQTVARAICDSIGAKFSQSARGLAFLWPGGTASPSRATITDSVELQLEMDVADFCNDLTIQYDFDRGQPRGSLRLVCPAQIARYGAFPQTLAATWITSAGVAQRVGARLLQQSARKQWLVTATGVESSTLQIGDTVAFAHSLLTVDGVYPVLSRVRTDLQTCTITARVPIGGVPAVAIASQSVYYDPNQYVSAEIGQVGNDWQIKIVDSDGVTPLAGASVQILPNGPARQTNSAGIVTFTVSQMPAGHTYTLGVTTSDGRYFTFGVSV